MCVRSEARPNAALCYKTMIRDSQLMRRLSYRRRFPELLVSSKAEIGLDGRLVYGSNVRINDDAKILPFGGGQISLESDVYVGRAVEISTWSNLYIGRDTSVQDRSVIVGQVTIGAHCLISNGIMAASGAHEFDLHPHLLIRDQDTLASGRERSTRPIVMDDDCWIGAHSVIVGGVRIGRGSVVGAGSVVTKDVPPYWVVGGVPARNLRQRLAYQPPDRIRAFDPLDWPYFYSGFDLSRESANASLEQFGGVSAHRVFRLSITASRGCALGLEIRVTSGQATLQYGNEERIVASEFRRLLFAANSTEWDIHDFMLTGAEESARLIVREAWIE